MAPDGSSYLEGGVSLNVSGGKIALHHASKSVSRKPSRTGATDLSAAGRGFAAATAIMVARQDVNRKGHGVSPRATRGAAGVHERAPIAPCPEQRLLACPPGAVPW